MPDLLKSKNSRGGRGALEQPPITTDIAPETLHQFPQRTASTSVVLFRQVSKWYGPVIGVNQVTLELRPGITGLVGANGSGKSTLMRLAAGQLRPDLGSVSVCGRDAWTAEAKWHVGFCPEQDRFYEEMTGRRFIETMARLCGFAKNEAKRRTADILETVGMTHRADRRLAGFSKGMRQRIKLAQALLPDPQFLLLDEPLSGIDPIGRRELIDIFQRLADRGKCLLVSSHELEELEKLTDNVAIMGFGRIVAVGTLTEIRDALDHHPLTIRLATDDPQSLAAKLFAWDEVVGVERDHGDLLVRARNPQRFFEQITTAVLEDGIEITHMESLDNSTHAVLGYLLGGSRNGVKR